MKDRTEPTISGFKVDPEAAPRPRASASAGARPQQRTQKAPRPASPQRPVVVQSKLALPALFIAIVAAAAAGYLYWMFHQSQLMLVDADRRIVQLEDKLTMAGDESSASVTALQASLKEAHSEIRKLWGVAYDRNRKSIQDNKNAVAAARVDTGKVRKSLETLQAEMRVLSDLLDAQQTALTGVEQATSAQQRQLGDANAAIQRKVNEVGQQVQIIEKDIEAINGFRRSVNQQLLELKGGASAP